MLRLAASLGAAVRLQPVFGELGDQVGAPTSARSLQPEMTEIPSEIETALPCTRAWVQPPSPLVSLPTTTPSGAFMPRSPRQSPHTDTSH